MKKTKLAKAISLTIAGAALTVAATSASAHVMYNQNLAANQVSGTDGWVWGTTPALSNANHTVAGPNISNFSDLSPGVNAPFDYNGTSHLNWAAALHHVGDTYLVSEAAALAEGITAEIDTGAGAWDDSSGTGWRHQTDIGLIKADHDMWVQINIARVSAPSSPGLVNDNFGVTVFEGMDTNTGDYNHHGGWNNASKPDGTSNPFNTTGVIYKESDGTVDMANSISFFATAGQVYSIYLGGAGVGAWSQNVSDYALTIRTSAVPVPAAAWLFGGALMSLFGANRRKKVLPA